jgi:hypothetical protein
MACVRCWSGWPPSGSRGVTFGGKRREQHVGGQCENRRDPGAVPSAVLSAARPRCRLRSVRGAVVVGRLGSCWRSAPGWLELSEVSAHLCVDTSDHSIRGLPAWPVNHNLSEESRHGRRDSSDRSPTSDKSPTNVSWCGRGVPAWGARAAARRRPSGLANGRTAAGHLAHFDDAPSGGDLDATADPGGRDIVRARLATRVDDDLDPVTLHFLSCLPS